MEVKEENEKDVLSEKGNEDMTKTSDPQSDPKVTKTESGLLAKLGSFLSGKTTTEMEKVENSASDVNIVADRIDDNDVLSDENKISDEKSTSDNTENVESVKSPEITRDSVLPDPASSENIYSDYTVNVESVKSPEITRDSVPPDSASSENIYSDKVDNSENVESVKSPEITRDSVTPNSASHIKIDNDKVDNSENVKSIQNPNIIQDSVALKSSSSEIIDETCENSEQVKESNKDAIKTVEKSENPTEESKDKSLPPNSATEKDSHSKIEKRLETVDDKYSEGSGTTQDGAKTVDFNKELIGSTTSSVECGSIAKDSPKCVRFAEQTPEIIPTTEEFQDSINNPSDLPSLDDSEYETPEPDDELGDDEDDESVDGSETGDSSAGSQVLTQREDGDGQEENDKKDKKLDHDEDKRDPQYIPKKGNFYEHDDRTSENDASREETPVKKPLGPKSSEGKERWGHDLYDPDMQTPKSRQELIDQYGYDIREEEGPPKARRRRRYGRGPNKYTRRWEEEEAYSKSRGGPWRGRGGRGTGKPRGAPRNSSEEFPPLPVKQSPDEEVEINVVRKTEDKKDEPPLLHQLETRRIDIKTEDKDSLPSPLPAHPTTKKTFKQVYVEEQKVLVPSRGRGRGRGRIPAGSGSSFRSQMHHHQNNHAKPSTAAEDIATLSQHFSEAVINVDNKSILPPAQTRGNSLPPLAQPPTVAISHPPPLTVSSATSTQPSTGVPSHHQSASIADDGSAEKNESSKSKRYSTQRQRSLPQGGSVQQQQPPPHQGNVQQPPHQPSVQPHQSQPPPPPPPAQRYIQDQYFHQGPPPPLDTATPAPPPPVPQVPPPQFAQGPPPTAGPYQTEVPIMAFMPTPPAQFQPLYCPPPTYLPPAPLPVQVSVVPQPPPPRPEVYQGAGGITYYNTHSQSRPLSTSRRVKLAIPIVPPPENS